MDQLLLNQGFPLLSILIFLAPGGIPGTVFCPESETFARYWALTVTTAVALLSLTLLSGFDRGTPAFQFAEYHPGYNR